MPQITREFNTLNEAHKFLAKLPGFCRGAIELHSNNFKVLYFSSQDDPNDRRNKYEKRIDRLMLEKRNAHLHKNERPAEAGLIGLLLKPKRLWE